MNFFRVSLSVMIGLISFTTGDPHKLTATSDMLIASYLYRRITNKTPEIEPSPPLQADDKLRICHHVTGSEIFLSEKKERIYMPEIFNQLRKNDPVIFKRLYETSGKNQKKPTTVYSNPTVVVDVHIFNTSSFTIKEFAFICLVRENSPDDPHKEVYREYWVSDEYNVSDDDTPNSYIAGRFVFTYNKDVFGLHTYALAEEPAQTLSIPGYHVEKLYIHRRRTFEESGDKSMKDLDVSSLKKGERLRLCTLVFKSAHFDGEVLFMETEDAVDETKYFEIEVTFRDEETRLKGKDEVFEERVIRCMPKRYYSAHQKEYYISRAYQPKEVFVYRGWGSKMVIENLFGEMRFQI